MGPFRSVVLEAGRAGNVKAVVENEICLLCIICLSIVLGCDGNKHVIKLGQCC